jgi:hypothetical protein
MIYTRLVPALWILCFLGDSCRLDGFPNRILSTPQPTVLGIGGVGAENDWRRTTIDHPFPHLNLFSRILNDPIDFPLYD